MASRNVILVAHMIKYGLPFGLIMVAANVVYALAFSEHGINAEVVGKSVTTFGVILVGSLVLGLIRSSKEDA